MGWTGGAAMRHRYGSGLRAKTLTGEVAKVDARPGGYVETGGHGGIIGQVSHTGRQTLTYLPVYKHTYLSDVNISKIPASAQAVRSGDGGIALADVGSAGLFIALYAVVRMAGQSLVQFPNQVTVAKWFERKRGRAMAVLVGIGATGLIAAPLTVQAIISTAGIADVYVMFVSTDPGAGSRALSTFVVPADAEGCSFTGAQVMSAPHPLGDLEMVDCRVPAAAMLGREGDGFKIGMATLDRLRPTVAAAACGMADRALNEAIAHALERHQFGQALADFQLIQQKLARMATELTAARFLVYRAAWEKDQ
ncbi:MAG: hypothetical protein IH789_10480, partial [Acidobacteria bacterium]|nr:hypothetical protein [Acidobacteriota bacterium]